MASTKSKLQADLVAASKRLRMKTRLRKLLLDLADEIAVGGQNGNLVRVSYHMPISELADKLAQELVKDE